MSRPQLTGRSEAVSAEEFNKRTKDLSSKMGDLAAGATRSAAANRMRAERPKPSDTKPPVNK